MISICLEQHQIHNDWYLLITTSNTQWLEFAYNNIKHTNVVFYFPVLCIPLYTTVHQQQFELSPGLWFEVTLTQNLNFMKMGSTVQYELHWQCYINWIKTRRYTPVSRDQCIVGVFTGFKNPTQISCLASSQKDENFGNLNMI